jgi:hypothetical protein
MFFASMWALKGALVPQENARYHQPPALTIGGIFGLAYVGLSLFGYLIVFKAVSTVNVFHFVRDVMAGAAVAMYITVFGPNRAKAAMPISGVLVIVIDFVVIWRHQLARVVVTVRSFSSINGFLIGITVSLAIFLWLHSRMATKGGEAAGSVSLPQ